jgi:hypothetical protein
MRWGERRSPRIDLGSGTNCDASATAPVTLGGTGSTGFAYYGLLEDLQIYNRALTSVEVQAQYGGMACP